MDLSRVARFSVIYLTSLYVPTGSATKNRIEQAIRNQQGKKRCKIGFKKPPVMKKRLKKEMELKINWKENVKKGCQKCRQPRKKYARENDRH